MDLMIWDFWYLGSGCVVWIGVGGFCGICHSGGFSFLGVGFGCCYGCNFDFVSCLCGVVGWWFVVGFGFDDFGFLICMIVGFGIVWF